MSDTSKLPEIPASPDYVQLSGHEEYYTQQTVNTDREYYQKQIKEKRELSNKKTLIEQELEKLNQNLKSVQNELEDARVDLKNNKQKLIHSMRKRLQNALLSGELRVIRRFPYYECREEVKYYPDEIMFSENEETKIRIIENEVARWIVVNGLRAVWKDETGNHDCIL